MPAKEAPRIRWLVEPHFDQDGVQTTAGLDHLGREVGDPVPLSPPLGLSVGQGDELHTAIRNLFLKERNLFNAMVQAEEYDTEDEANDFLCPEDLFPPGNEPWEDVFEFPAEPVGDVANGSSLASGAVKGGSRGPEEPTPPATTNQTASLDSSGVVSRDSGVKKPIPVSELADIGKGDLLGVDPSTSRK